MLKSNGHIMISCSQTDNSLSDKAEARVSVKDPRSHLYYMDKYNSTNNI